MNGASTPAIGVGSISSIMFSAIDRKSRLMETPRRLIFVLAAFPIPDYVQRQCCCSQQPCKFSGLLSQQMAANPPIAGGIFLPVV